MKGRPRKWSSTNAANRLDVNWLRREGFLSGEPATSNIVWAEGGRDVGSAFIACADRGMVAHYTATKGGSGEGRAVSSVVRIDWSPCNFGGRRPWFLCPACGERRQQVYFAGAVGLRCRACAGLRHPTVREDRNARLHRRAEKIRGRLGGGNAPFPVRPPRMWGATYDRLIHDLVAIERALDRGFLSAAERLLRAAGGPSASCRA